MHGISTVSRGAAAHLRHTLFFCSAASDAFSLSILCSSASTVSEVTVAIFFNTLASDVLLIVACSFSIFSRVVAVLLACRSEPAAFAELVNDSARPARPDVLCGVGVVAVTGEAGAGEAGAALVGVGGVESVRPPRPVLAAAVSGDAERIARTSGVFA